jgi:hypothetical protein
MARLILRALALLCLAGLGATAHADPITGVLATTLFTVGTVTVTVGTALFALSVATSVYGSIQTKKKALAAAQRAAEVEAANLKDRTTTLMTADSPWPVIYGQPAPVGGSLVAVMTSGNVDQFKHLVLVLASHECAGVDEIFIGGESVGSLDIAGYASGAGFAIDDGVPRIETHAFELVSMPQNEGEGGGMSPDGYWMLPVGLDAANFTVGYIRDEAGNSYGSNVQVVTSSPVGFGARSLKGPIGAKGTIQYTVDGPGSALNVQIHLSPGGVDTADTFLRGARPDLWTVDHKLSGFTYLVVTLDLRLERFQGGVPEITARVRGKKVYDYRTGQTAYSRNPALCLADFIRSEVGYKAGAEQIELDAVIAAANACDVAVYDPSIVNVDPATYGFTTTRYTCDGMFRSDQDRDATRQQIEDAMVGFSLESGGVWRIQAGAWSTPVLSLTDDDMVMPMNIVQTCNVGTARYNGAKGTYVNATRLGVTEDFTPYVNANFRAQDVKDKFFETTLSFTGNHIRTQQISRVIVEQSRGGFVVQIFPKMFAWNLQPGDRVVLSSVLYGFANKGFRVQDWTYQAGTPVALQCVEDEEAFYDQVDEVRADAAPNTQLPSPFLKPAPPLDLIVLSGESQMIQQDGVMIVRAKVQWARSPDQYVLQYASGVLIQWRAAGTDDPWQNVTLPGDATEHYLLGLQVNRVYVIRVAFVTPYASSAWSVVSHELHGLEGPPDSVLGLDVRAELTGIFGYWAEPAGIDLLGWSATQIRRGITWELAENTILFDGRASSANLGWFPAGSQLVWAAHHNTTGKWSTPVYDTIEILGPKQPQPVITVENRNTVVIRLPGDYKGTQPLREFEVLESAVGADISTATLVTSALANRFEFVRPQFGEKQFWVVAVDVAGNRSAPGYGTALTLASYDSEIGSIRGVVQASIDELAALEMEGWLTADGKLAAVRAGVYEKIETVVTDTTALAKQYQAVTATVGEYQSLVSSQVTTVADKVSAQATQISIVAATTAENTAAIVEETNARATAVSAVATQVTTVQSSVSTLSGTVQTQSNTLANLNGNVAAQYMVRTEILTASGKRAMAGLSLGVSATGAGTATQSEAIVFADRFIVVADASSTVLDAPFRVEGGVVYINVAKIKNADIDTLKVAGYALTISLPASGVGTVSIAFTVPAGQVWRAVARADAGNGPVMEGTYLSHYVASLALTGAAARTAQSVLVGVSEGEAASTSYYQSPGLSNQSVVDYPAGAQTITATWSGATGPIGSTPDVLLVVDLHKRGA